MMRISKYLLTYLINTPSLHLILNLFEKRMKMRDVIIRKANFEDAAEIANVHINSWREVYKDLLSKKFLDERPLFFKNRYELWRNIINNNKNIIYVAESNKYGIVGFISGSHGRDSDLADYVEIGCLYLLEKLHGRRIGFNLLKILFETCAQLDYKKGYLWVLENNPAISFYEKTGGKFTGRTKEDEIGGQKVTELCYIWDNINLISTTTH